MSIQDITLAHSEAFAHLIGRLIQNHVDSYTGSPGFVHISEPDAYPQPTDEAAVQFHVTMPDGSEYRIEIERVT